MDQVRIGRFIAELRREHGLTQAELGGDLGVTNKTVSRWENGNYMPDLAVLPELAARLGVSVNELIAGQRFAEAEYKRGADEQLLQTMRLISNVRDIRKSCWLLEGMGLTALVLLMPIMISMIIIPPGISWYEIEQGENNLPFALLICSVLLFVFGLILRLIFHKRNWLLYFGIIFLILCFILHNNYIFLSGIFLFPLLFSIILLFFTIAGYQVYFQAIDNLLENTKKNREAD